MKDNIFEFFEKLKSKSVYKNLKRVIVDESVDDFLIAKALSSLITHSIIELEITMNEKLVRGKKVFEGLSVVGQTELLNRFIRGEVDGNFVKGILQEEFGPYFRGKSKGDYKIR